MLYFQHNILITSFVINTTNVVLEMMHRMGENPKFGTLGNWIEEALESHFPLMRSYFSFKWTSHSCDVEGCGWAIISGLNIKFCLKSLLLNNICH